MTKKWTRACKTCSKRFEAPTIFNGSHGQMISPRQTCSATCAAKFTRSSSKRWTAEEDALLMDLAGSAPKFKILKTFNRHALKNGQIPRGWVAIRKRAHILKVSLKIEIDYFVIPELARRLGIGKARPTYWTKIGLKFCFKTKTRKYISKEALVEFARKRPDRFSGIKYGNLILAIDDLELCRFIAAKYPKRLDFSLRPARRVVCIESKSNTRRVYNSISAAKRDSNLYLSRRSIERCLKLKIEACGYRFEYLD